MRSGIDSAPFNKKNNKTRLQQPWFDLQLDALNSCLFTYTKMHGQPTTKICNAKQARQIYQYKCIICE